MASKRDYQEAMRLASSAAWDLEWATAIEEYRRALEASADDAQAMTGLAQAMMETGNTDEALRLYKQVHEVLPSDPLPLEKIAEIHERAGSASKAANAYLDIAELYYTRKDYHKAVENWEQSLALNPDLAKSHMRLALWYEQRKDINKSIVHFVEVARLLQASGKNKRAEESLQRALAVDPVSTLVRNAIDDLRRQRPIQRTDAYEKKPAQTSTGGRAQEADVDDVDETPFDPTPVEERSPAGEAAYQAMQTLSEMVWEGTVDSKTMPPLLEAINLHQAGDAAGAIENYEQVKAGGLQHPALDFNLAILYEFEQQDDQAVPMLRALVEDPSYTLAAKIGLGKALRRKGQLLDGARYLLDALQLADDEVNSQTDEAGYHRMREGLADKPDEHLAELCSGLSKYLDDERWRSKLSNTLVGYAAQGRSSYVSDLVELIVEGGRPVLAEIMQRIDRYIERNMLELASQETHYAIEKSPDYLPAHRRIADILSLKGHTQEAAEKINFVAETYLIRGNEEKAADLFTEVIKIWPADMEARRRVLQMFKNQRRVSDALAQYIDLADLYRRMADADAAMRTYEEALHYAQRHRGDAPQTVVILKALADIESQRLNSEKALNYYEQTVQLAPDDEDAALAVVDLYFQLGEPNKAVAALDAFMRQCITRGKPYMIVTTLEDQVEKHPNQIEIRRRLAQVYERQKRTTDALVQLNEIGDAQIEQGDYENATKTIRKIISLNPPDAEQYRQLLRQLESSG